MKIKRLSTILIYLLSLILVGMIELINADFSIEVFKNPAYWYTIIGTSIANMLILFSTAKTEINIGLETNKELLDKKEKLTKTIDTNVEPDLDDFLKEENKRRKIIAWEKKIYNKISKLEQRAKQKDIEVFNYGTPEQKLENKYCKKRESLFYKISKEYIDKNIVYLKIKYPKLKRYEITTGCEQKRDYYQLTTKVNRKIVVDTSPKFLYSFGMIMFFSSFDFNLNPISLTFILTFSVKLISLILNIINGKEYGKNFIERISIPDLQFRLDVIINYMSWKLKNKNKVVN